MAQSLTRGTVSTNGDAILWLWEAHNSVNLRLRKDISSDPSYPKVIFPPQRNCPYCYNRKQQESIPSDQSAVKWESPDFNNTSFLDGESFLQITSSQHLGKRGGDDSYVWNRTAVLFYLWNFYHFKSRTNGSVPHVKLTDILHIAWPKKYPDANVLHKKYFGMSSSIHHGESVGLGFSHVDTGLCVMSYGMCVLFLAVMAYLLMRKKRIRKLFVAYP